MNRNKTLVANLIWHKALQAGTALATFTDDAAMPDAALMDCLSPIEKEKAAGLHDRVEFRHFIARRCFQRLFICGVVAFNKAPAQLSLIHRRDMPPQCLDAPGLSLSFSSSGPTAIACARQDGVVGIDVERVRPIENAVALAGRYFTPGEADALAATPKAAQGLAFLHCWTAKEAGLKAVGKGIVDGLNTFTVKRKGGALDYRISGPALDGQRWCLEHLEIMPQHVIALVTVINVISGEKN